MIQSGGINPNSTSVGSQPVNPLLSQEQSANAAFSALLDQISRRHSPSSGDAQKAAIQAQNQADELEQEYLFLSGMVEQSRLAMNTQKSLPGQTATLGSQDYYYWKSQLTALQVQIESQGL
jgi:small-conductance mechanosensitive channel